MGKSLEIRKINSNQLRKCSGFLEGNFSQFWVLDIRSHTYNYHTLYHWIMPAAPGRQCLWSLVMTINWNGCCSLPLLCVTSCLRCFIKALSWTSITLQHRSAPVICLTIWYHEHDNSSCSVFAHNQGINAPININTERTHAFTLRGNQNRRSLCFCCLCFWFHWQIQWHINIMVNIVPPLWHGSIYGCYNYNTLSNSKQWKFILSWLWWWKFEIKCCQDLRPAGRILVLLTPLSGRSWCSSAWGCLASFCLYFPRPWKSLNFASSPKQAFGNLRLFSLSFHL